MTPLCYAILDYAFIDFVIQSIEAIKNIEFFIGANGALLEHTKSYTDTQQLRITTKFNGQSKNIGNLEEKKNK